MKKLFILAMMAVVGAQAQAQIVSSRSSMTTREVIAEPVTYKGWSTFGVEYLPSTFSVKDDDSQSFTGLAVNYTNAISLTQSTPLFIEWGIGAQYSFNSEEDRYEEVKVQFASVKIPVNLVYDFQIPGTNVNIDPYLGLKLRGNVWGESKYESKEYDYSKSFNLFDSDEGDCNRIQLGWNIGVKARFNKAFFVGIGYGSDFSEFAEDVKINEVSLSLGVVF